MDGAANYGLLSWTGLQLNEMLDQVASPVMIADSNYSIQFVNRAANEMFAAIEKEIQTDLPHFRHDQVLGKSMDIFHRDARVQRRILDGMNKQHNGSFTVGGKFLSFRATPVFNPDRVQTGVIVEWKDDTAVRHAAKQVAALMGGVKTMSQDHEAGMIKSRIDLSVLDGEYLAVGQAVNAMVEGHIEVQNLLLGAAQNFADGDFGFVFDDLPGDRAFISEAIGTVQQNMKGVVDEIQGISQAIVDGRLDIKLDPQHFKGSFRQIVLSCDAAIAELNGLIHGLTEQFALIADSTGRITSSASTLSMNSQSQSAAVEEISASVEETDHMVRSNSEASRNATELFTGSARLAEDGLAKVERMVNSVEGIRVSSEQISRINKVIEEIAFQTNLLALNAAVEAARAGQHGRGFAVVAQEVRNLAGRSSKAAKETGDLIDEARKRVNAGVEAAAETQNSFEAISEDIIRVRGLIDGIAKASEEQSRGVSQINQAISDLSRASITNSQQAEELTEVAQQLSTATESANTRLSHITLRDVTVDPQLGAFDFGSLPPAMRQQIEAMMRASSPQPAPKAANAKSGASPDRDHRGYGKF